MSARRCLLLIPLLWVVGNPCYGQKEVYIPDEWEDDPALQDWSWDRSHQSENFVVFWGPALGSDPRDASNPDLRFRPEAVTDTLEKSYDRFVDDIGFVSDGPSTKLGTYKIVVVMNNTWGAEGPTGWAYGGSYSETIGAMWVHPNATQDGAVLSHEFAHALQSMNWIQENTNGGGFVNYEPAGFFWEAHANFLRAQQYPDLATEGMPRWWATDMYHWSSTRHHYQAYRLLLHMQRRDGLEMVNRLWHDSEAEEHPLMTYRRLKGWGQSQLNDFVYDYAKRDVTYDYPVRNIGRKLRNEEDRYRREDPHLLWRRHTMLEHVGNIDGRYRVPTHAAPQDYGFNVIPLHPVEKDRPVRVKFKGHTEVNATAGWRYGFVTENSTGRVESYGPMHAAESGVLSYTMTESDQRLYLVVVGAPTEHTSYEWEPGWPKIKRYPYEINVQNAVPEGHQPDYRAEVEAQFDGEEHPNGGGFVAASASVAADAYVGPDALVLGTASVSEKARIEDAAWVQDATVEGRAVIGDHATVYGGTYSGEATVRDFAVANHTTASEQAQLGGNMISRGRTYQGDVVVGGDAEIESCAEGVYLQVPHPNNGREMCDGHGRDHAANEDVNNEVRPFPSHQMRFPDETPETATLKANFPNPFAKSTSIPFAVPDRMPVELRVYDLLGRHVKTLIGGATVPAGYHTTSWSASDTASGIYLVRLKTLNKTSTRKVTVVR